MTAAAKRRGSFPTNKARYWPTAKALASLAVPQPTDWASLADSLADHLGERAVELYDLAARLRQAEGDRDRARRWAVELEQEVGAVKALHVPPIARWPYRADVLCVHCLKPFPCPTRRLVERVR